MGLRLVDGGGGDRPPPVRAPISTEMKRRMVILFAQFHTVSQVQKAITAEFGVELDRRTVQGYDLNGPHPRVGARLRTLFESVRSEWIGEAARVGISHQTHRLRILERLIDKAEAAREYDVAGKLLEQAAKEMGGVLTNITKHKHEGKVGHFVMSPEDARQELAMRLNQIVEGGELQALPAPSSEQEQVIENKEE